MASTTLPWVVDPTVANSVALVGSCFTILMWLSPIRDVWVGRDSIFITKGAKIPASSLNYVAAVFNCILWIMYGSTRLEQMLIAFLVNCSGLILNASFTLCYWYYSTGSKRATVKKELGAFFLLYVLAQIIWIATGSNDGVGYIAMAVNIMMFYGPLSATRVIVRARSHEGLPLPPLILQFIASIIWTAWAIYLFEIPIAIPNSLGVIFAALQMGLWVWAFKQHGKINHEGDVPPGLDMGEIGIGEKSAPRTKVPDDGGLIVV